VPSNQQKDDVSLYTSSENARFADTERIPLLIKCLTAPVHSSESTELMAGAGFPYATTALPQRAVLRRPHFAEQTSCGTRRRAYSDQACVENLDSQFLEPHRAQKYGVEASPMTRCFHNLVDDLGCGLRHDARASLEHQWLKQSACRVGLLAVLPFQ
jgi:hypothetical protein